MRDDAIMRIQSMTKAITAVTALRLVEAGRIGLDQSVEEWLPELGDRRVLTSPAAPLDDTVPAKRPITLRHLLTLGSGLEFGQSRRCTRQYRRTAPTPGRIPSASAPMSGSAGWRSCRSHSSLARGGATTSSVAITRNSRSART